MANKLVLGIDKAYHLAAGWIIALLTFSAILLIFGDSVSRLILRTSVLLTVTIVAIAKEVLWDKRLGKGTPDVWDALATILGGILLLIIF